MKLRVKTVVNGKNLEVTSDMETLAWLLGMIYEAESKTKADGHYSRAKDYLRVADAVYDALDDKGYFDAVYDALDDKGYFDECKISIDE